MQSSGVLCGAVQLDRAFLRTTVDAGIGCWPWIFKPGGNFIKWKAKFAEIASALGIHFEYAASHTSRKYLIETMGSGVALFDYDNDGRLDIFVVNGAPLSDPTPKGTIPQKRAAKYWNRLYHQKRDGTFEDVTEKAGLQGVGYGMGVAVGDYDNDGFEDLYVTAYGGNRL